jgi:histidine triad (HIT) family protein
VSDCVFCSIVAGEETASYVYRDELCTAFMDIQPVNPGHVLIVPNRHAADLSELDGESGAAMFLVARKVAAALRESGLRCEGVNLWLADGEVAGQEVFHVHLHVLPRFEGDGFGLTFPDSYSELPHRAELDGVAARIRGVL